MLIRGKRRLGYFVLARQPANNDRLGEGLIGPRRFRIAFVGVEVSRADVDDGINQFGLPPLITPSGTSV